MPGGDRNGPAGFGPMSGRGRGYCAGNNEPGYMNPGFGRGLGRGSYGGGRGYGHGMRGYSRSFGPHHGPGQYGPVHYGPGGPFYRSPGPEDEIEFLQNTARALEEDLKAVKRRLDELDGEEE